VQSFQQLVISLSEEMRNYHGRTLSIHGSSEDEKWIGHGQYHDGLLLCALGFSTAT